MSRFLLASLPPLCHLSLDKFPPSLLKRLEAPALFPQPPCRHVPRIKLSPPRRMSSAQANLQQHPRSPPPGAKLGSAQCWQLSQGSCTKCSFSLPDLGFLDEFSQLPSIWVQCTPWHCHASVPAWGWLPSHLAWLGALGSLCAWGTAAEQPVHGDCSPAAVLGAVSCCPAKLLPEAVTLCPQRGACLRSEDSAPAETEWRESSDPRSLNLKPQSFSLPLYAIFCGTLNASAAEPASPARRSPPGALPSAPLSSEPLTALNGE